MVLVDLGLGPKLDPAVFLEVNPKSRNDIALAQDVGHPIRVGECIRPERIVVDQLSNDHARWNPLERQGIVDGPRALLQSANMLFDFGYVIIVATGFRGNVEVGKIFTDYFN